MRTLLFSFLRCAPLAIGLAAFPFAAAASDLYRLDESRPITGAPAPAPGKAMILFVRPQTMGFAVKVKLYADGKFLGLIMSKSYIAHECEPGKHEFIAAAENAGFLEAEVLAGKTYVVQVSIHMGAMKARTHFETGRAGSEPLREIVAKLDDLRAIETTAEGRAWAEERADKFQETIRKYREKGEEFETLKPEDGFERLPWAPAAPPASSAPAS